MNLSARRSRMLSGPRAPGARRSGQLWVTRWAILIVGLALGLAAADRDLATAELRVQIIDRATRQPMPGTVRLVDSRGAVVLVSEGFKDGFRANGGFTNSLPPGACSLRITRGPEFKAAETNLTLQSGAVHSVTMAMERQIDLRRRGWFAGDHHAHMIHGEQTLPTDFDAVALAAQAEDLQCFSLAHAWALSNPTPERLTAELTRRSTPDCVLTWNVEAPKNYYRGDAGRCLGHCWNLGMSGRTPAGADVIAILLNASAADYEVDKPPFANFESHALIHAQGGAVFYTHPARWWMGPWGGQGGYPKRDRMRVSNLAVELPLDVLAGPTFDGLDVITGAGEVAANENAFQLWAMLLNHGYRLAATASSDACFDRSGGATPGAARLYTWVDGPFSIAAAARAARQGRTFATTGPLLLTSVAGQPPGSAFPADGQERTLQIEAWPSGAARGGLGRIELLRNGKILRRLRFPEGANLFRTNHAISERESAWYCVRAFGADEKSQRAISGAFYFDAQPWRAPEPVAVHVRVQVVDAASGKGLDATLNEVAYLGTEPQPGRTHHLPAGAGELTLPANVRLRAEAAGHAALTLSPFLDDPRLIEWITGLEDRDLLEWSTYARVRTMLESAELVFRLRSDP